MNQRPLRNAGGSTRRLHNDPENLAILVDRMIKRATETDDPVLQSALLKGAADRIIALKQIRRQQVPVRRPISSRPLTALEEHALRSYAESTRILEEYS